MTTSAQQATLTQPTMAPVQQTATVTTTRSSIDLGPTANTTATIDTTQLAQYPALTLDERLRQHAGFELFRRSSSWVANPTSEGISLRGLGSTAASRTLVLSDNVPLNDPFGGWIHWDEQPPQTIEAVTLADGGGSDLYGSSALGGVIDVIPAQPLSTHADLDLAAASEDTTNLSAASAARHHHWGELLAAQDFRTDGYTTIAPNLRGPIDVPSNVHFENGRIDLEDSHGTSGRAFLTGNLLNEARGNGTRLTNNGTRLWRYILGDDWSASPRISGRIRGFGSDQAYRQSFSSVNATRTVETLTRLQHTRIQEFGVTADASLHLTHLAFITGADIRDIRAFDFENLFSGGLPSSDLNISARQRFYGAFGEVLGELGPWSASASIRGDEAENITTHTFTQTTTGPLINTSTPDRSEAVVSPRIGLVRTLPRAVQLHASAFRAFRTPTMNELYRTGQVGQQTTLPNASLLSERATGAEGGATWASPNHLIAAQGTYFWTEINRPVAAVLLSSSGANQTLQRENLGQIQSQGTELAVQLHPIPALTANFGYQYAHATVTRFQAPPVISGLPQASLVGLWIPDVPRNTVTAQLHYTYKPAAMTLSARESGRAFDDSLNQYELHSFFVLDAYAETRIGSHFTAYFSAQNLLNRSIETARTPNLTLGTPFIAQGGIRLLYK